MTEQTPSPSSPLSTSNLTATPPPSPPPPSTPTLVASNISNTKNYIPLVLDFSNYDLWKTLFIPVFESHGVMSYIDGTSSCPPSLVTTDDHKYIPNSACQDWKRIDAMVLSWIQATISVDILRSIVKPDISLTAREAWLKISELYLSQAMSQEVQLKRTFVNFKKLTLPMLDYITQMKGLADSLIAIGIDIQEKDLVSQLCTGLEHRDYNSIITTITNRLPLPTFLETRSMLLNFEAQLHSHSSSTTEVSSPTVFYASRNSSTPRSRNYRARPSGSNRPNKGRYSQNFGSHGFHPNWRSSSVLGPPPLVCQYCGQSNHSARECPQLNSKALYVETQAATVAAPS